MGKRVAQADGTYCYTENCRIHDRSGNAVGIKAAIHDAESSAQRTLENTITQIIKLHSENDGELSAETGKNAREVARQLVDSIYNNDSVGISELNIGLNRAINGDQAPLDADTWEKLSHVSVTIHNNILGKLIVKENDEVIIRSTGQRGVVMEGSSLFGGRVRVNVEDSLANNDFAWHTPDDIAKIHYDEKGLGRERIVAAPRFTYLEKEVVGQLFDEESNLESRNPQGLHGVKKENVAVVREEFMDAGQRFVKGFPRDEVSKGRIVRFVREESYKRRSWLSEEDQTVVKTAFTNLLSYLDPKTKS